MSASSLSMGFEFSYLLFISVSQQSVLGGKKRVEISLQCKLETVVVMKVRREKNRLGTSAGR